MPLEQNQEGAEDGVTPSRAGSKRRARASVTSSGLGRSTSPTAITQPTGNEASSSTTGPSSDRPRRASRVFSQIKDGFKRSESTRSVAGAARTWKSGKEVALPAGNVDSAAQDMVVQGLPQSSSYAVEKQSHAERRDKRRRIGEYVGPSRVSSSENVASDPDTTYATPTTSTPVSLAAPLEPPTKEAQQEIQQDADTAIETSETAPPQLFSPPIVPLTDSDPFLDDRLRSLEAIRSVLGDDVVRRLPSVQSLRDLNHAHASVEPAMQTSEADLGDRHSEVESTRRISIPPSTLDLLHDLESTTAPSSAAAMDTPYEENSASTDSTQRPSYHTAASTISSHGRTSTQQSERNARRASIRNFTNRLGGWLGVGTPRNETSNEAAASSATTGAVHNDMSVDPRSTPVGSTSTVPANGTDTAQTEANTSGRATASTSTAVNRLATGAVMIVQGFVQTTAPVRERRTRINSNSVAGPSRQGNTASTIHHSATQPDAIFADHSESLGNGQVTDTAATDAQTSPPEAQHDSARSQTAHWGELPNEKDISGNDAHTSTITGHHEPSEPSVGGAAGTSASSGLSVPLAIPESSGTAVGQSSTAATSDTPPAARGEQPSFVQQARMLGGLLR